MNRELSTLEIENIKNTIEQMTEKQRRQFLYRKELSRNNLYILTTCAILYAIYRQKDFRRRFIWHIIMKKLQIL